MSVDMKKKKTIKLQKLQKHSLKSKEHVELLHGVVQWWTFDEHSTEHWCSIRAGEPLTT
jgi:hypothetical protein